MTTSDEAIQLIAYLRDHRFIGQQCWADAGETQRDHEGFACALEILDYLSWEHDMRTAEAEWVGRTYYQLRSLAADYWRARTGSSRVRTDAWTRYHHALRQTVIRMEG